MSPRIPYIFGPIFTHDQLRIFAESMCTPDELRDARYPETALNRLFRKAGIEECFVAYHESRQLMFLWVLGVVPSFDGKVPEFTIPALNLDVHPEMRGKEYSGSRCIEWPRTVAGMYSIVPPLIFLIDVQQRLIGFIPGWPASRRKCCGGEMNSGLRLQRKRRQRRTHRLSPQLVLPGSPFHEYVAVRLFSRLQILSASDYI